jgi:hypothetical protein
MSRCLLVLSLALFGIVPATALAGGEPTRLGALLRAYLAEHTKISRQEELLSEIRRITKDDPAVVAAAIRKGEHFRWPEKPAFRVDGIPPVFEGRTFRCDLCAVAIARSAGQYARLILPPRYDRTKRYPLLIDIGELPRVRETEAVIVWIRPSRHPQARNQAVAVERLVLGLIAHTMDLVPIDPDRVFLRGSGTFGQLVTAIGFANPGRFAGIFIGEQFWSAALAQAVHARYFSLFLVAPKNARARFETMHREFARFTRAHILEPWPANEKASALLRARRAGWQRIEKRTAPRAQVELAAIRPEALRCHWIRMVPKSRSRREVMLGKTWKQDILPRSRTATLNARLDVQKSNYVQVKSKNVLAFQIYVDPLIFNVDLPLRVSVNGRAPTAHLITPDIGEMLDDYRERGDPGRLCVDRIAVP